METGICSNQMKAGISLKYIEDCSVMQGTKLGEDCPNGKALSNFVCYEADGSIDKVDGDGCGSCSNEIEFGTPEPVDPEHDLHTDEPLEAVEGCSAGEGAAIGSWKCGTHIYYCKDVASKGICAQQLNGGDSMIPVADCSEFDGLVLGKDCPVQGDEEARALSNFVWYNADGVPVNKVDGDHGCELCEIDEWDGTEPPVEETPVAETPAPTDPVIETVEVLTDPPVEECPMDYLDSSNGLTYPECSGESIVSLRASAGYDGDLDMNGVGVIYDIELLTATNEVTFKVNNMFDVASDVYVKYEVFATIDGSVSSFRNPTCDEVQAQPACVDETYGDNTVTAACRTQGYAVVYVYYATTDPAVLAFAGEDATIDNCCYPEGYDLSTTGLVELSYKIECDCPPMAEGRYLRGSKR